MPLGARESCSRSVTLGSDFGVGLEEARLNGEFETDNFVSGTILGFFTTVRTVLFIRE